MVYDFTGNRSNGINTWKISNLPMVPIIHNHTPNSLTHCLWIYSFRIFKVDVIFLLGD